MFSGMVRAIGIVEQADQAVLAVRAPLLADVVIGASICVSGVCLSVVTLEGDCAYFDLGSETRRCTTLGSLKVGARVHLEPSVRFSDTIDGHLVQGHVDATARVLSCADEGNTVRFECSLPEPVRRYVVPKGAIAIDGVSLTVGEVEADRFAVYIIPHTLEQTLFSEYREGSEVNIEADMIARYLDRLAAPYRATGEGGEA
ncbi:MAG: riboflavin synthase [Bdellovibrionales bacterium]|nr:riboflavin synthase [Bdellovibrionales bacterium]